MGIIYKITNLINKKSYIGQTSKPLNARWKEHKTGDYHRQVIDMAIKKYGKENFTINILEECSNEKLDERERYWIAYYDTYNNGYNSTEGGQLWQSTRLSEQEVQQIIQQWKNTDLCLSRFHKYVGHGILTVKNYLLQNGITQEEIDSHKYNQIASTKKIQKLTNKNIKNIRKKKPHINQQEKLKKQLAEEQNILQDFLQGHGLTFLVKKYHKTFNTIKKILNKNNITLNDIENNKWNDRTERKWKIIYCYDLNGVLIKKYDTRKVLLEEYSLKELKLIHNCCNGLKKTALNKKWSYTPLNFSFKDIKHKEKKCQKYDKENNLIQTYNSIKECSEANNISSYKINNSNKKNVYYDNYRYKILS